MNKVPKEVIKAFEVQSEPACFDSGQGVTYRCGDKVLKPTDNNEAAEWIAELFYSLDDQKTFRFPRPLKSVDNKWVVNGWVAWSYIQGEVTSKDKYQEQFKICDDFHKALEFVTKPDFIDKRNDPWSIADRVAWQEIVADYDERFMEPINEIQQLLHPIEVSNQIIHGDMLGNILFSEGLLPAVIDFSFYWRPVGFAKAVMIADAIVQGNADNSIFGFLRDNDKNYKQLILRAIFRRIVEQLEHVKQFGTDIDKALNEVGQYQKIIKMVENPTKSQ